MSAHEPADPLALFPLPNTSTDPPMSASAPDLLISRRHRNTRALLTLAAAILLLTPIAAYFWFLHTYGVNAVWYDQWENVGS